MASLPDILQSYKDAIERNKPIAGDGIYIEQTEQGKRITAQLPHQPRAFVAIKLTSGPDANYLYGCDLYEHGTDLPATTTGAIAVVFGWFVDTAVAQGFYLARPALKTITGTVYEVWEVFPNLPAAPDAVNTYFLMSIAGEVQWVRAGDCTGAI